MRSALVLPGVVLGLLLLAPVAHAAATCVLRVGAGPIAPEWRVAVLAAAEGLSGADTGDCVDIVVDAAEHGARVTFRTRDGRVAERHLRRPSELPAVVAALTVGAPDLPAEPARASEPAEPPASPEVAGPPLPAPEPPVTGPAPVDPPLFVEPPVRAPLLVDPPPAPPLLPSDRVVAARPGQPTFLALAIAGARTSGKADAVAAAAEGGVGLVVGPWELDVIGHGEAERDVQTRAGQPAELSSLGAGVRFARRGRLGPLEALAGLSLQARLATLERHEHRADRWERSYFDPRGGVFVGAVGPRLGPVRVRGELHGELALASRTRDDLPATPAWGLGALLGLETTVGP